MMRLEETDAVQAASTMEKFADGAVMVRRHLSTDAKDSRQSEEGETLKAVERICQKFESGGKPHKFPAPGYGGEDAMVKSMVERRPTA
jgi:hypothetical protein